MGLLVDLILVVLCRLASCCSWVEVSDFWFVSGSGGLFIILGVFRYSF